MTSDMAIQRSDQSLSLSADTVLGRHPDDFYLDYSPYCPPSAHPGPHSALGLEPLLVWQHPVLGRLLPSQYDPSAQSVLALRHLLNHLLADLTNNKSIAPPALSLFVVLSATQLSDPRLSQWFLPVQLVMDYHHWSLSLALLEENRKQRSTKLISLCGQGPMSVLETAQSAQTIL